jgi:hypothetical protein
MGSLRFRIVTIAPGLRLNPYVRSVGVFAGFCGARASINSGGRSALLIGIPGARLYCSQTGPRRRGSRARVGIGPNGCLGDIFAWVGAVAIVPVLVAAVGALLRR